MACQVLAKASGNVVCPGGFWCGGCTLGGFGKAPVREGGSCCEGLGAVAGSLGSRADLSLSPVPACPAGWKHPQYLCVGCSSGKQLM